MERVKERGGAGQQKSGPRGLEGVRAHQMRWQRCALKVAILTKMATLTKMANSRQNLTNVPMTWQRDPSESGYFGENGIFGENMAKFAKP